jgi:SAM-dependent methyltransferase
MVEDSQFIGRLYPEYLAGRFTRSDGNVAFFIRVNSLLRPDMTVLDYGAGRAEWFLQEPLQMPQSLRLLKGKVDRVVGVDIDPAVLSNPAVDDAYILQEDGSIPVDDASVDLVVADHTFEHVREPRRLASEIDRVLKPGGWVCARTPNRWGYIGIGARVVPNRLHGRVLSRMQATRQEVDIFPTFYRMNTRSTLKGLFDEVHYQHAVYSHNPEPAYFGRSTVLWRLVSATSRVLPDALGATLHVFLRKK